MKHVYDSSMIGHLWANQGQDWAKNRQGNFSFRGASIFSYNAEIARHVHRFDETVDSTRRAVLIADRRWSSTTNRHQSHVRRALGDIQRFHVIDLGNRGFGTDPNDHDHDMNRDHYAAKIAGLLDKASRARKYRNSYLADVISVTGEANDYAEFFGLDWHLGTDLGEIAAQQAVCATQKAAREAEEQRKADERLAEAVGKWKAGNTGIMIGRTSAIYLRIRDFGKDEPAEIETSRGARFLVADAVKAWRLISACRARGEGWERNGHMVRMGSFQLDAIDSEGNVQAGCHTVRFEESQRLAKLLGLTEDA